MERTLAADPPAALYLEFWPEGFQRAGYSAADLVDFLHARGYHLHLAGAPEPLDRAGLATLASRLTGLQHADLHATR